MARVCTQSDVVITTAQLFGRRAPVVISKDIIAQMKPGTIIVDMAVESGGNVEGSKINEEVITSNGVHILGMGNLPGRVAVHASQVYSTNLHNLLEEYWDKDTKAFKLNLEDEIIKGALITHQGQIVNETVKKLT
jgi:NAD(P) transhydrogenase subunit alpha